MAAGTEGAVHLMMRLYWPSDKATVNYDGTWKIPQVKVVD